MTIFKTIVPFALAASALTPMSVHAQDTSGNAASGASDGSEIIVTAQRREQSITDVPISMAAVSQEAMVQRQIRTTLDLPKVVAGLEVSHNGLWTTPTIRGVGSRVGENSIAQYVDGVYIPNPVTALNEFAAVERVEVLKGPQGTLFGRNATGGAIIIVTPDPDTKNIDLRASVAVEERDGFAATAYVNIPVSDAVAINVSGNYRKSDGWVTMGDNTVFGGTQPLPVGTPLNPLKHKGIRTKIRLLPAEGTDIILSYWHGEMNDPGATAYSPISNQLFGGDIGPLTKKYTAYAYQPPSNLAKFDQYVGKISQEIGDFTLQSTTSYRKDHNVIAADVGQTALTPFIATWDSTQKSFSQEFILNGTIGNLDAVAGLFIFNDRFVKEYAGAYHRQKTESVAPFIDLTYNMTDRLKLIGGLRYTYEKRKFNYESLNGAVDFDAQKSFKNWSPRAVVQYDVTSHANVYASYSIGYKSGLFNTDATGLTAATDLAAQPLDTEKLTAYEIGFKHGSRGLNLAVAGFYYDWKNIQTNRYVGGNTIAQNGPKGEIYGVEASVDYRVVESLTLSFNGIWMHGRFKNFPNGNASVQGTAGNLYDLNNPGDPLSSTVSQDWSGLRLINAPDISFNAGFTWELPVGPGTLSVSPNVKYSSTYAPNGILLASNGKNLLERGAQTLVDMSVGYAVGRFKLTAYARNLFNNQFYAEPNYSALGIYGLWVEPQTFGARLEFKY